MVRNELLQENFKAYGLMVRFNDIKNFVLRGKEPFWEVQTVDFYSF